MKQEAIWLRIKERLSNQEIADRLGIAYSTVQTWLQSHPLTKEERARKMALGATKPRPEFDEKKNLTEKEVRLKYFGLGLYAGEGDKTVNCVGLCNSNPRVVVAFLRFLRCIFRVNELRLRASLQLKDFHDVRKAIRFWSEITGIPVRQFGKSIVTKSNPKKNGKKYLGTCRVRYSDQTLLKRILSMIDEMGVLPSGIVNESVKLVPFG